MNLPVIAALSVLVMPLAVGYLCKLILQGPDPHPAGPKHGHGHDPVLLDDTTNAPHITFDCPGEVDGVRCVTTPKLRYDQCSVAQANGGYVLVAVCRKCGSKVCSRVVNASVMAVFMNEGATSEHPRIVAFHAELDAHMDASASETAELDAIERARVILR